MKTYSTNGKAKNPKKTKYAYLIVSVCSVFIIALTVTLAVVLSRPAVTVNAPEPNVPSDITPDPPLVDVGADEIKFGLPLESATLTRQSSLARLVYMASLNMWKTHNGVDFAAAENAPVLAVADGKVVSVETTTLEGTVITIEHRDGFVSVYKSLATAKVAAGDEVKLGGVIGTAGKMMTESSEGVHVHLELALNGVLVDPLEYIDAEINK